MAAPKIIGEPIDRVDGRVKVTGAAKYAAEYDIAGLHYGVFVTSSIAKGRITAVDAGKALRLPGVIAVISHLNRPDIKGYTPAPKQPNASASGEEFRPFYNDRVYYNGQPVALVVADTFERALHAARVVNVSYAREKFKTDLREHLEQGKLPQRSKGDYLRGQQNMYAVAPVSVYEKYEVPVHIHNAMEPHATIAVWDSPEQLTVYNKTQGVKISQQNLAKTFGLKPENVSVISRFVGGAFGSASAAWPHELAAVIAAKKTGKPVKVVLSRDQMFGMVGHRPTAVQHVGIGATAAGKLVGITHEAVAETASFSEFTERLVESSRFLYDVPNMNTSYRLAALDIGVPTFTRGPGETSGVFALESAMDELSYKLRMDPVAFRLKNIPDRDLEKNLPWSSNNLAECYRKGMDRFGWEKRNPAIKSMMKDGWHVGMGMSSAVYGAHRREATATATWTPDGRVNIRIATADTGPGTATIMMQIASETLDMDMDNVSFELGDSKFTMALGQFGSMTTASVGSAVHDVCVELKKRIKAEGSAGQPITVVKESKGGAEQQQYSFYAFGASFVEVLVHPLTGVAKVSRVVSVIDNGRIMNQKTARSQVIGSVTWGIGMALMEEAVTDHRFGRYVNHSLADYHVPVNADVPDIDVLFIDKADNIIDPIGAKGLGEIGLVGFAAAVTNAIYHATGIRIRELPVTPDKLLT